MDPQLKALIENFDFAEKEIIKAFGLCNLGENIIEKIKDINKNVYKKILQKKYREDCLMWIELNKFTVNDIMYLKTYAKLENKNFIDLLRENYF
jgi:hypothetical protein